MNEILKFRGLAITRTHINAIRQIITLHPQGSRRFISQEVCRKWNWVQPNGLLKDMLCRTLLLQLESKGFIKLPPPKRILPNPLANRQKPPIISIDREAINCSLNDLLPIELKQVRKSSSEKLFNSLISQYHYLGYSQPIGEHLKYIAYSHQRPIACLGWCSAPWYIGVRDRFIGWPSETRQKNLHLIITNTRFLIPPWVEVYNLASHILAMSRHCVPLDWQEIYKHGVYLMESFIDTEKFIGTCYKADNWICLGETTGRGKLSKSTKPTRSRKAVYCYPLLRNFREVLNEA